MSLRADFHKAPDWGLGFGKTQPGVLLLYLLSKYAFGNEKEIKAFSLYL
jgi:hypothetical protein